MWKQITTEYSWRGQWMKQTLQAVSNLGFSWSIQTTCNNRSILRAKESQDFRTQEADEGFRKHFSWFLCCVVEEVLWVSQHIKQCLHELLVLVRKKTCCVNRKAKAACIYTNVQKRALHVNVTEVQNQHKLKSTSAGHLYDLNNNVGVPWWERHKYNIYGSV